MFHNKKGFELSANFIVMLILATVALSLGIVLVKHMGSSSTSLTRKSYENFMDQLIKVNCDTTQKACIAPQTVSQFPGKSAVYSLQINNNFNKPMHFKEDTYQVDDNGNKISSSISKVKSLPTQYFGQIPSYSSKTFPVVVMPVLGTPRGTYNILVNISYSETGESGSWKQYDKELVQLIVK